MVIWVNSKGIDNWGDKGTKKMDNNADVIYGWPLLPRGTTPLSLKRTVCPVNYALSLLILEKIQESFTFTFP